MERRNFLRNAMMAIAVSLVPKILQPVVPELPECEYLAYPILTPEYEKGRVIWVGKETLDLWNKWWDDFAKQSMIGK